MKFSYKTIFFFFGILISLAGCSHFHRVLSVETRPGMQDVLRVSLGSKEIKEGDKVEVFSKSCSKNKVRTKMARDLDLEQCSYVSIGKASVLKVLGSDSSLVLPEMKIDFTNEIYIKKDSEE